MKEENLFGKLYNEMDEYVELRANNSTKRKEYELVVDHFKIKYLFQLLSKIKVNSILEIGSALGILLNRFPLDVPLEKRTGIDLSEKNIEWARINFPNMDFYCGSLNEFILESPKEKFAICILSDILEHVEDDVQLLKEAASVSDFVLLNLPLEKCEEFKDRIYGIDDYHGHLRAYDESDAMQLIDDAGLIEVSHIEKSYVQEPVFRNYLANKLINNVSDEKKIQGTIQYINELNHIDLFPDYYKSNYFALLKKK